mgnify:CR=1 FL=1
MARLQVAIKNLVEVFMEYSDGDGKLNKEEMKKMMDKEMDCPEAKVRDSTCSSSGWSYTCMYIYIFLITCSLG